MNELSSEMWKEYKKKQYWRIWSVAFQVDRLGGTGENLRQNQDETSRVSQVWNLSKELRKHRRTDELKKNYNYTMHNNTNTCCSSQDNLFTRGGRDLNPEPPAYKAGLLPTRPWRQSE